LVTLITTKKSLLRLRNCKLHNVLGLENYLLMLKMHNLIYKIEGEKCSINAIYVYHLLNVAYWRFSPCVLHPFFLIGVHLQSLYSLLPSFSFSSFRTQQKLFSQITVTLNVYHKTCSVTSSSNVILGVCSTHLFI